MTKTGFIQPNTKEIRSQLMVKERNLKRIFDLLIAEKKISRAAIASKTKLSPTTVSTLTDEMIGIGLVKISGVEKTKKIGRKAILLEVNAKRLQIPTIAWERSGFRYILYDLACNELESLYFPLSGKGNYAELLHDLIIEKSKGIDTEMLGPICITIPAIVDAKSLKITSTVLDFKGQEDFLVDVKNIFIASPVIIGNESVFYAYAEKEFALDRKAQNIIYININVGVGAGIIYRGKIYRGSFGMAGEFGHTTVDINGPLCSCGSRGCLERLISTPRILERVVAAVKKAQSTILYELCEGKLDQVTLEQVAQAFIAKDEGVVLAMKETAEILGFGINNVLRIFDPETIVVGGGIEIFGEDFLTMLKNSMASNGSTVITSGVQIVYTKLPPTCKNRGAAKYYIDKILRITEQREEEVIIC